MANLGKFNAQSLVEEALDGEILDELGHPDDGQDGNDRQYPSEEADNWEEYKLFGATNHIS